MISFSEETFQSAYDDSIELHKLHNQEVNIFDLPIDIDVETFNLCESNGALKTYVARDNGNLVGYAVFFIYNHPHHKASIQAKQDVVYISTHKRGLGISFIKFCDSKLKEAGIDFVIHSVNDDNDWSPVLLRQGYDKFETSYIRSL